MDKILILVFLFVSSFCSVFANDFVIRKYQYNYRKAKDKSDKKSNFARARAAKRKLKNGELNLESCAGYWRNRSLLEKEVDCIIKSKPNNELLKKAVKLSSLIYSTELKEFICEALWKTGRQQKAYKATKKYLAEHESAKLRKYMLLYALNKKKYKDALIYYHAARLSLYERVIYFFKLLLLKIKLHLINFVISIVIITLFLFYLYKYYYKSDKRADYRKNKIIGVTSNKSETDRSLEALKIAFDLVKCGNRVLLVDADLTDKRAVRYFDYNFALKRASTTNKDEIFYSTSFANIDLLPFEKCKAILAKNELDNFVMLLKREYETQYDIILIVFPAAEKLKQIKALFNEICDFKKFIDSNKFIILRNKIQSSGSCNMLVEVD